MVRATIGFNEAFELQHVENPMDFADYVQILTRNLRRHVLKKAERNYIFQQDCASVNTVGESGLKRDS